MKHLLLTTIAAVVLVGCTAKPPDIPIEEAVEQGNIEAIKQHLAAGADVNGIENSPPLAYATTKEVLELLIANGANVNEPAHRDFEENGTNILHEWALFPYGKIELIQSLIEKGANVNAKDFLGHTPLDKAIEGINKWYGETRNQKKEIAKLLRKLGGKSGAEESIKGAASLGDIEAVKKHLANDAKANDGLFGAAMKGYTEIVKLLIEKGADVNTRGYYSRTSLHATSNEELVLLLISKGADVNAKDRHGETPLHLAQTKEIAELLISKGADVNANTDNKTPLDSAYINRDVELFDLLRKHGGKTAEELKAEGK